MTSSVPRGGLLENYTMEDERPRTLLDELRLTAYFEAYNDIARTGEVHGFTCEWLGTHSALFELDVPRTFDWSSVLGMLHSAYGKLGEEFLSQSGLANGWHSLVD